MKPDRRHPSEQFHAWARLLRTYKIMMERVQKALSEADLPPLEWYDVLLELDFAEGNRLRMFDLGERLLLSRSNLSRLCDRMEKEGLVSRQDCAEDRRGLYVMQTKKGAALRMKMWPVYRDAVAQNFAGRLTAEDARSLSATLLKIRD